MKNKNNRLTLIIISLILAFLFYFLYYYTDVFKEESCKEFLKYMPLYKQKRIDVDVFLLKEIDKKNDNQYENQILQRMKLLDFAKEINTKEKYYILVRFDIFKFRIDSSQRKTYRLVSFFREHTRIDKIKNIEISILDDKQNKFVINSFIKKPNENSLEYVMDYRVNEKNYYFTKNNHLSYINQFKNESCDIESFENKEEFKKNRIPHSENTSEKNTYLFDIDFKNIKGQRKISTNNILFIKVELDDGCILSDEFSFKIM